MTEPIRTIAEMTAEARAYVETVDTVDVYKLARVVHIGDTFAAKILAQFEAEGLVGPQDRQYRRNVRSASGELAPPASVPGKVWEEYALEAVQWILRKTGKNV